MQTDFYLPLSGPLHRLHPSMKILSLILMFALTLSFNDPRYVAVVFFFILLVGLAGRCLRNLVHVWPLLLALSSITFLVWTFVFGKGDPMWSWGWLVVKRQAAAYGLGMALRLTGMVVAGLFLLSTTSIEELTYGLTRLGLPYRLSFAFSLAFRLVPTFLNSAATISQAQRARGLDLEKGNVFLRIRKHIPLLIPIFASALRRTDQLAMALETKGFGARTDRTSYLEFPWTWRETAGLVALAIAATVCIWLRCVGRGAIEMGM